MQVARKTIERMYELFIGLHHATASSNSRDGCLICEKILGLPPFSFLGNPELAKDKTRTHSTILARLGFEIKEEEPAKRKGESDKITRYPSGFK